MRTGLRSIDDRIAVAAAIALVVMVIGLFTNPRDAATAFLVAWLACLSVVLATMAMIMIATLTAATWFRPLMVRAQAVMSVLTFLAALAPLHLLTLFVIYPWAHGRSWESAYLNVPFFTIRAVVYWAAWLTIRGSLINAARVEAAGDVERAARQYRRVACAGLIALGLTMSFAAFDWIMSLTPEWYSTIFGVVWFAGGMVGSLSLLAILAQNDETLVALAKLLLAFILLWVYVSYSQYIVIWSADLPHEITWFVARTRGGWGALALILLFMSAVVPAGLLFLRAVKQKTFLVAAIGMLLLSCHYVDTYWLVVPALVDVTPWMLALSVAAAALVIGPAIVVGRRSLGHLSE